MANHDDATLAHVEESARYGMTIAEFPTTLEAAQGCQALNMKVLMGAPNVVRGGSHSGNVAAAGLARAVKMISLARARGRPDRSR